MLIKYEYNQNNPYKLTTSMSEDNNDEHLFYSFLRVFTLILAPLGYTSICMITYHSELLVCTHGSS